MCYASWTDVSVKEIIARGAARVVSGGNFD